MTTTITKNITIFYKEWEQSNNEEVLEIFRNFKKFLAALVSNYKMSDFWELREAIKRMEYEERLIDHTVENPVHYENNFNVVHSDYHGTTVIFGTSDRKLDFLAKSKGDNINTFKFDFEWLTSSGHKVVISFWNTTDPEEKGGFCSIEIGQDRSQNFYDEIKGMISYHFFNGAKREDIYTD